MRSKDINMWFFWGGHNSGHHSNKHNNNYFEYLLGIKHCSKHFVCVTWFNTHNSSVNTSNHFPHFPDEETKRGHVTSPTLTISRWQSQHLNWSFLISIQCYFLNSPEFKSRASPESNSFDIVLIFVGEDEGRPKKGRFPSGYSIIF